MLTYGSEYNDKRSTRRTPAFASSINTGRRRRGDYLFDDDPDDAFHNDNNLDEFDEKTSAVNNDLHDDWSETDRMVEEFRQHSRATLEDSLSNDEQMDDQYYHSNNGQNHTNYYEDNRRTPSYFSSRFATTPMTATVRRHTQTRGDTFRTPITNASRYRTPLHSNGDAAAERFSDPITPNPYYRRSASNHHNSMMLSSDLDIPPSRRQDPFQAMMTPPPTATSTTTHKARHATSAGT